MKMETTEIGNIRVEYEATIPEEELPAYVERAKKLYGGHVRGITLTLDPDDNEFICIQYVMRAVPFQRLRRITGYLVGDMGRWNNAKRAEEKDRVKHGAD